MCGPRRLEVEVVAGRGGAFACSTHHGGPRHRLALELRMADTPLAVQPGTSTRWNGHARHSWVCCRSACEHVASCRSGNTARARPVRKKDPSSVTSGKLHTGCRFSDGHCSRLRHLSCAAAPHSLLVSC